MDRLLQDLRFAVRTLARTPAWTVAAVVTLALGTGANAAVFSFVDALVLRPAPGVGDGASLVAVFTSDFSSGPYGDSSYPDFVSIAAGTTAFDGLAASDDSVVAPLRVGDDVSRVRAARVSGNYFDVLKMRPAIGRFLNDSDCAPGSAPIAVVSDALWRRLFAGDPAGLGTVIRLNGRAMTIVGVVPPAFHGLDVGHGIDVWIPLTPPPATPVERGNRSLSIVGRLRGAVSMREAQAQLTTLAARLAREFPDTNRGTLDRPAEPRPMIVLAATRIEPSFRGEVVMVAAVLMGGVALVLLLACANVASLVLSRSTARAREFAVRRALGASTARLLWLLLTESAVVGCGAAALGLLLAAWSADALPSFFPAEQAALLDASIGPRVVAFGVAAAAVSTIIVALLPAVGIGGPSLAATLRGASAGGSDPRAMRTRSALVVAQISVALVLLVTAALLAQSVSRALRADLGFTAADALLATVELPSNWNAPQGLAYYQSARADVIALPGVEAAAWVRTLPLAGGSRRGFRVEGYGPRPGEDMELPYNVAGEGYFEALGITVLAGRSFTDDDQPDTTKVAIVNDVFARTYFGGAAVGRHVTDSGRQRLEIVGVVRSGKYRTVDQPARPLVYYPATQLYASRLSLVVRSATPPDAVARDVTRALHHASRDVPVFRTVTLREHLREALAAERLMASLVGACGVLALTLCVVGLYGTVAYSVAMRTREIGIRMALGAEPAQVVRLVVAQGIRLTAAGVVIGLGAAAATSRLVAAFLYEVGQHDVLTYAAVALVLVGASLAASFVPAKRALAIQPAQALVHE